MKYTTEQNNIITNPYKKGDVVSIFASAGAAKTTTMLGLCKHWQDNKTYGKVLYLVYNTSMREEAEKKFKKAEITEVEVKTTHGLAYQYVGVHYRHKLQPNIRKTDIKNRFKCSWEIADAVLESLKDFFNNDSEQFSNSHGTYINSLASKWWSDMKDRNNKNVSMTHDGYLKLFSLANNIDVEYDAILIDEAQDSNNITLDIVLNKISSTNTIKIFTGDPFQQIYQFRGSSNIMDKVKANTSLTLSKSFRFGKNIALLASKLTDVFDDGVDITGNEKVTDKVLKFYETSYLPVTYTWIARTNIGVIIKGFELMAKNVNIHFLKGISNYVNDLWDVYYLMNNKHDQITSKFYKSFRNIKDLTDLVKESKDTEKKLICAIVSQYNSELPVYLDKLKSMATGITKADIILTNVHTSKGLEFDNVILDNDFMTIDKIKEVHNLAELNLIYVASTRAKHCLVLNKDLSNWYKEPHIESQKQKTLSKMFS
jgi:superfamily I DNA/RNA helicase